MGAHREIGGSVPDLGAIAQAHGLPPLEKRRSVSTLLFIRRSVPLNASPIFDIRQVKAEEPHQELPTIDGVRVYAPVRTAELSGAFVRLHWSGQDRMSDTLEIGGLHGLSTLQAQALTIPAQGTNPVLLTHLPIISETHPAPLFDYERTPVKEALQILLRELENNIKDRTFPNPGETDPVWVQHLEGNMGGRDSDFMVSDYLILGRIKQILQGRISVMETV